MNIDLECIIPNKFIKVPLLNNVEYLYNLIRQEYIIYRNWNGHYINRKIDSKQMKMITDLLSKKYLQNT